MNAASLIPASPYELAVEEAKHDERRRLLVQFLCRKCKKTVAEVHRTTAGLYYSASVPAFDLADQMRNKNVPKLQYLSGYLVDHPDYSTADDAGPQLVAFCKAHGRKLIDVAEIISQAKQAQNGRRQNIRRTITP
jgi:predicted translin family RNA/ssDNA-binding protein